MTSSNVNMKQLANEMVNMVFYGPMMRNFRAAQRPNVFGEGPGSGTFVQMLDQEFVKRMSARSDNPLADALLRQLTGRKMDARDLEVNAVELEMRVREAQQGAEASAQKERL